MVTCIVMLSTTVFLSLPIGIVQDHYQNIYREQLEKEQKIAVEMEYSKLWTNKVQSSLTKSKHYHNNSWSSL